MREHFVVPPIRSREVIRAQRSFVRHCEDALKVLDFGNGLLGVLVSPSSSTRRQRQIDIGYEPKTPIVVNG